MTNDALASTQFLHDGAVAGRFLDAPDEESFADLFKTFSPQLVAFFRARNCDLALAEDLAQEVMFTVYRKATQIRDRALFRAWMFKIARNTLCRHYGKQTRKVDSVDLADVPDRLVVADTKGAGTPAFDFHHWISVLDSREREALVLRFVEQWEYHEIADAQCIPIGTVQWRVFSAKKKLAPHLKRTESNLMRSKAA
jgi:RNA polymerase sigma-70 factor, ECF subfamily